MEHYSIRMALREIHNALDEYEMLFFARLPGGPGSSDILTVDRVW